MYNISNDNLTGCVQDSCGNPVYIIVGKRLIHNFRRQAYEKVDEGYIPQPGDVAVWKQNVNGASAYGHVAVVVKVYEKKSSSGGSSWVIDYVDQDSKTQRTPKQQTGKSASSPSCYIHPDFPETENCVKSVETGYYYISSKLNGYVINLRDSGVEQALTMGDETGYGKNKNLFFVRFVEVESGKGYYELLQEENSSLALTVIAEGQKNSVADNASIVLKKYNSQSASQKWLIISDENGGYYLKSRACGKYLKVLNSVRAPGGKIVQFTADAEKLGKDTYHWSIVSGITGVVLERTRVSMQVGDVVTIGISVRPQKPVNVNYDSAECKWESNNPAEVAVDEKGYIRAVSKGTAQVTVTIRGKTAACQVVVR